MFYVANYHCATLFFERQQRVCTAARHVLVTSPMMWLFRTFTLAVVHVWLALFCVFAGALHSLWLDMLLRPC